MAELDLSKIPDRGHRDLAAAILQAAADLQLNTGDVQSVFGLSDLLFQFIGELLDDVSALNIRADAAEIREQTAQDAIDALQQRVAQLESPLAP